MNQFWSGNECENSHTLTQQQPQAPKTHKKMPTIRLTTRVTMLKGPFFTASWSWMKSSARHTLSNQQDQLKEAETVNLIDAKSLSRPLAWLL